jgi:hypothetical protein
VIVAKPNEPMTAVCTRDYIAMCEAILDVMHMARDDRLSLEDLGQRIRDMFTISESRKPN